MKDGCHQNYTYNKSIPKQILPWDELKEKAGFENKKIQRWILYKKHPAEGGLVCCARKACCACLKKVQKETMISWNKAKKLLIWHTATTRDISIYCPTYQGHFCSNSTHCCSLSPISLFVYHKNKRTFSFITLSSSLLYEGIGGQFKPHTDPSVLQVHSFRFL